MPENTQETRTALEEAAYHKLNKSVGEGTVVRVVGTVVDVKFDGQVPGIYTALIVDGDTPMGHVHTVLEVESQLEGGVVRTVAMSSTDGLTRGLKVKDTGHPMMMPVGPSTLGRVWNVMGEPVDNKPAPAGLYVAGQDSGGYFSYPYTDYVGATCGYALTSGMMSIEHIKEYLGK